MKMKQFAHEKQEGLWKNKVTFTDGQFWRRQKLTENVAFESLLV